MLYYQDKDYKNAQKQLERTIGLNPNYSNALYFLGLTYSAEGLADFVAGGWAEPTEAGKSQLELVWRTLCDIREMNPDTMYDSPADFFKAQV